jgi:L,D-peptidoglycan transpeptidase YkuD (ErfK/YbiS/YcfS/YnhG family)
VVNIYYRKDRIKKIISEFKPIEIKKNMGWCDDPNSKKYNQFIRLPSDYSYEKLYRNDNLYDLILVLNYNMDPITKNKGSAIFIHITNNYKPTKGCVGLKKRNLIKLIKILTKKKQIKIKH